MRSTLAIALGLAAVLFLAPLTVAPARGYRENGTTSTAVLPAGATFVLGPTDLHRLATFGVQPLDDEDDEDDDDDEDGEDEDVEICHVPPGNPAAAHSIWVGASAVPAHMGHPGETLGSCDDEGSEDDDGDGDALSPSISLSLSASTIEEGQSVVASWTVTDFVLDGAAIGSTQNVQGRGHVHVLVDGELVA